MDAEEGGFAGSEDAGDGHVFVAADLVFLGGAGHDGDHEDVFGNAWGFAQSAGSSGKGEFSNDWKKVPNGWKTCAIFSNDWKDSPAVSQ